MFGFSFSELVVVILVALVVMGPKDLPKMLRRLGQWAGKLRRAAAELRAQSGIDDALRAEGLADDIAELRKLARGELDAVNRAARLEDGPVPADDPYDRATDFVPTAREYPRDGADSYGALPDNAIVYAETLAKSPLARDPLYVLGDATAELPPETEPQPEEEAGTEPQPEEEAETEPQPEEEAETEPQPEEEAETEPQPDPVAKAARPEARTTTLVGVGPRMDGGGSSRTAEATDAPPPTSAAEEAR